MSEDSTTTVCGDGAFKFDMIGAAVMSNLEQSVKGFELRRRDAAEFFDACHQARFGLFVLAGTCEYYRSKELYSNFALLNVYVASC